MLNNYYIPSSNLLSVVIRSLLNFDETYKVITRRFRASMELSEA